MAAGALPEKGLLGGASAVLIADIPALGEGEYGNKAPLRLGEEAGRVDVDMRYAPSLGRRTAH